MTSLHWLLQEPLVYGSRLDISNEKILPAICDLLLNAGVLTLGQLFKLAGLDFENVDAVVRHLGLKSKRITAKLLEKWKSALTSEEVKLLEDYTEGSITPDCNDPFPDLYLLTDFEECEGVFLQDNLLMLVGPNLVCGKILYKNCVKTLNKKFLHKRVDTPWRSALHLGEDVKPEWRALYKSPVSKKVGDLQWRILHGAIAVNAFVSVINHDISDECPFCFQKENIFHAFVYCIRLVPLFQVLKNLFGCFDEIFSLEMFICGFKYIRRRRFCCQLLNFLLGQAKKAIYDTRKIRIERNSSVNLQIVFLNLVKSRILIDFRYYKAMGDLMSFELIWCYKGVLCEIINESLQFAYVLK